METVTIPAINCSFVAKPNAKQNECLQNFEKWISETLKCSSVGSQKFVALVSRAMPQASAEYLLFASKVMFLEKRFVEVLNHENGERLDTIDKIIQKVQKIAANDWSGVGELSPIEKIATDIVNSGKQFLNPEFEKRFLSKLISYLKALSELESQRRRGYLPSLTEALIIRQCAASTEMFVELCEAGMNLCMTDENRCDSVVQRMIKAVIKLSFFAKDLSSFQASDDYNTNIVNTLKRCRNYSWQKAVDEAVHLYTCELASFTALEKLVDVDELQDGKTVKKYLKMLKFVIKAMHEFNEVSKEKSVRIQ